MTLYKVDLKSFDDRHYRELGGRLQPILDTIQRLHDMDVWLELVTLLIPGFNDGDDELKRLTEFVVNGVARHSVACDRVSRRLQDDGTVEHDAEDAACEPRRSAQRPAFVMCMREIFRARVGELEHTHCPQCHEVLIERFGYLIREYNLTATGACPSCGTRHPRTLE